MVPSKVPAEQQSNFRDCSPGRRNPHRSPVTQCLSAWWLSPGILGGTQCILGDLHGWAASAAAGTDPAASQHREWDNQQLPLVWVLGGIGFQQRERMGIHVSNAPTYPAPPQENSRDSSKTPLRDGDAGQLPKTLQLPFSLLFPPCFHSAVTYFGSCDMQRSLLTFRAPSCPLFGPWHGYHLYIEPWRWQHWTGTSRWEAAQGTSISSSAVHKHSLPDQSWSAWPHCCFWVTWSPSLPWNLKGSKEISTFLPLHPDHFSYREKDTTASQMELLVMPAGNSCSASGLWGRMASFHIICGKYHQFKEHNQL